MSQTRVDGFLHRDGVQECFAAEFGGSIQENIGFNFGPLGPDLHDRLLPWVASKNLASSALTVAARLLADDQ